MKRLTVRLPEALVSEIEAESRKRMISKSDVVRECLTTSGKVPRSRPAEYESIADLVGSSRASTRFQRAQEALSQSNGLRAQTCSLTRFLTTHSEYTDSNPSPL
jgi:Arc/MetJ-type ribon-helix-helix transcriptional regulator